MAASGQTGIPRMAQHFYRQALDIKNAGKNEDALRYLNMAVAIAPHFCSAYNVMGNCLDEMGRYREAVNTYGKVIRMNPDHHEARFKMALVRKKIGTGPEHPFSAGSVRLAASRPLCADIL